MHRDVLLQCKVPRVVTICRRDGWANACVHFDNSIVCTASATTPNRRVKPQEGRASQKLTPAIPHERETALRFLQPCSPKNANSPPSHSFLAPRKREPISFDMPAAPGPPPPSPPSELSSAQNSLLRLSRRHSLPANVALSGLLGFLSQLPDRNDGRDAAAAALSGRRPRVIEHTRSSSVIVTRNSTGSEGAVNRHRYGHRHTRSEAYDQPIIVKNYNPGTTAPVPQPIEEVGSRLAAVLTTA